MFILSQDGKNLIQPIRVTSIKNFGGGREEKYMVLAYDHASGIESPVTLAYYPDEESALREIGSIAAALERGETVYRVVSGTRH